jgi:hypothetical protein
MGSRRKKGGRKGVDPENVIEAAIVNGLSEDKAEVDSKPVYAELAEKTKSQYAEMMRVWKACVSIESPP